MQLLEHSDVTNKLAKIELAGLIFDKINEYFSVYSYCAFVSI